MSTNRPAGLSRRQLLQGMGAGAASVALSCASFGSKETSPQAVDVVVIGAGAAGTRAARELMNAGKSVVLIEANDRIQDDDHAGRKYRLLARRKERAFPGRHAHTEAHW